jgi:hypothetical protein
MSRRRGFVHVEASQARVFMSDIKTSGGMARMVHMASSRRLRQSHVEDGRVDVTGCVGPCYLALSFSLY